MIVFKYSSGGKSKFGRITKAGDSYLRTLLVQGARSVLIGAEKRTDSFSRWVCSLVERRGYWRAVVAIAAKTQGCAGHRCITVMTSGCIQPAKHKKYNHLNCNSLMIKGQTP